MARAATKESPRQRARENELLERFRSEYADALAEARISAEHTATEGWRALYGGFRSEQGKRRASVALELRDLADRLEAANVGEEGEKQFTELKKTAQAIREDDEAFDRNTVEPVRSPADLCRKMIFDVVEAAKRLEDQAPLVNSGLADDAKREVAAVAHADWDAEGGRVTVSEPGER